MPTLAEQPLPIFSPSILSLSDGEARSWIQVAKTGKFFSNKYGWITIGSKDLQQMLHNFKHVTPIAPTQLPVDYDHLSMNPKHAGDGKAAGWFTGDMELRNSDAELWAEIEWTEPAADSLRKGEYRFISPSFLRSYKWKNGEDIGTTLIAAAITNHPFLEGMAAVTLMSAHALGEVGLHVCDDAACAECAARLAAERVDMMEVGQAVGLKPDVCSAEDDDPAKAEEADDKQKAKKARVDARSAETYSVAQVVGNGNDQFALLEDGEGHRIGWYRANEVVPAKAPKPGEQPAEPAPADTKRQEATHMAEQYNLRDERGQETQVSAEGLQQFIDARIAAAKTLGVEEGRRAAVPEGNTVIAMSDLEQFRTASTEVVELRNQVTNLTEQHAAQVKANHLMLLNKALAGLAGRITKPQADWALKNFGEPSQLEQFNAWKATVPEAAIVELNREHGSGQGTEQLGTADAEINAAANAYIAEERTKGRTVDFRTALSHVSRERVDLSNQFHEEGRQSGGRGQVRRIERERTH